MRKKLMLMTLMSTVGLSAGLASVPRSNDGANDTVIYQNLHEIKVSKVRYLNFDSDIERLSAQEKSHREALPLRVSAPMERVMKSEYRARDGRGAAPARHKRHWNRAH